MWTNMPSTSRSLRFLSTHPNSPKSYRPISTRFLCNHSKVSHRLHPWSSRRRTSLAEQWVATTRARIPQLGVRLDLSRWRAPTNSSALKMTLGKICPLILTRRRRIMIPFKIHKLSTLTTIARSTATRSQLKGLWQKFEKMWIKIFIILLF